MCLDLSSRGKLHKGRSLGSALPFEWAGLLSLSYFCIKSCLEPSEKPLTTAVDCSGPSSLLVLARLHHFPSILGFKERRRGDMYMSVRVCSRAVLPWRMIWKRHFMNHSG